MSDLSASQALAEWVCELDLEKVPEETLVAARKALIDSVGTAIGAYHLTDVGRAFGSIGDEEISGPCTVMVTGDRLPGQQAVWLNGVLMNTLGQEETHITSGTHPAETTVPVVLSLAERLHSTGPEVLAAVLAGVEVTVRAAHMELTPAVKYDNCEAPAAYGTIGAGAAAAKLAKLDAKQTADVIGLATNIAAGLSECVKRGHSDYHYSVACASMHAYMALALVRQGATSVPTVLEGDGGFYQLFGAVPREELAKHDVVADLTSTLGDVWEIGEMIYKPYPVNFFNQAPIDGAREMREKHGLKPEEIDSVRLEIGTLATASGGPNRPPYGSREGVLGATGFCVAAMLARGAVGLDETNAFADEDILAILERTEIEPVEGLMTARLTVKKNSGEELRFDRDREGRDYRLGEPEIHSIFLEATANAMDQSSANRLLEALAGIDTVDDFATVMSLTVANGGAS
jgi:2-methylcitrate dehydratase PrpD